MTGPDKSLEIHVYLLDGLDESVNHIAETPLSAPFLVYAELGVRALYQHFLAVYAAPGYAAAAVHVAEGAQYLSVFEFIGATVAAANYLSVKGRYIPYVPLDSVVLAYVDQPAVLPLFGDIEAFVGSHIYVGKIIFYGIYRPYGRLDRFDAGEAVVRTYAADAGIQGQPYIPVHIASYSQHCAAL